MENSPRAPLHRGIHPLGHDYFGTSDSKLVIHILAKAEPWSGEPAYYSFQKLIPPQLPLTVKEVVQYAT